jgi:ankyrin repeat protein
MSSVRQQWYQLRDALEVGDFSTASSMVTEDSSLIDQRNGIGETVLHFLAVENNLRAVEWLHARGSDLNAANAFGTPLLFEVAQLGYRELFRWLLTHGADPKRTNAHGQSITDYLQEFDSFEMRDFVLPFINR